MGGAPGHRARDTVWRGASTRSAARGRNRKSRMSPLFPRSTARGRNRKSRMSPLFPVVRERRFWYILLCLTGVNAIISAVLEITSQPAYLYLYSKSLLRVGCVVSALTVLLALASLICKADLRVRGLIVLLVNLLLFSVRPVVI